MNSKSKALIFYHLIWKEEGLEGFRYNGNYPLPFRNRGCSGVKTFVINTKLLTELYDDQVDVVNVHISDNHRALNLDKREKQWKPVF